MNGLIPLPPGHKSKEPSEIIRITREKVQKRPNEPGGYFYLGCAIYHLRHDIKKAMSEFEKSIECDKNFLEGYKALTATLLELRDDQGAEKALKRALKIKPKDTDLLITYADLLERGGRCQQGKKLLMKAKTYADNSKTRKIIQNRLNQIESKTVPEFIEVWAMARKDCYRSSFVPLGELQVRIGISQQGYLSFDSPINPGFLPDIPCPIVAGDIAVFPDGSMKSFRGVKVSNINEVVWKPGVLADRLIYSSTPVYVPPYLFFSLGNSIRRVNLSKPNPSIEPLVANPKFQMSPYCAPTAYENIVIFAFRECIYCYDLDEKEGNVISLNTVDSQDILRSPVICDGEVMILSRKGRIFTLDILAEFAVKENTIPIKGTYSAPCVIESNVYFEIFDEEHNSRKIAAYCPKDGSYVIRDLSKEFEELCSQEDLHLNFSPLVFRDTVLVASDVSPVFYQVRRIESLLEVIPLELDIQVGHQKVVSVSHVFSTVLGSYLISKSEQGFFYVKLEDLSFNSINNLISGMVTQPIIVDKDRIFFLCRDGIECFLLQRQLQQEEVK